MSYFDDASLVMIPSGYKTSKVYSVKPTSGDGDLTFTRSNDTATRVGPDGLIEKVRTNLLLQSNGFNTASWFKTAAGTGLAPVITANAGTAPDGTNNAFRVQFNCVGTTSSDRSILNQSITSVNSTQHASSVYIKAFSAGEVGKQVRFITEQSGSQIIITLTADWQRVVNVGTSVSTSLNFVLETRGGVTANTAADVLLAFAQLETGDIATQYIPTTTAAVSVGPVANVPRLDYLNSSCPRLLLEPQATALNQFSEQIDNAYWSKSNCTVTANQTTSPSGYVDAELILDNTLNDQHAIGRSIAVTSGNKYTASFFLKAAGYTTAAIRMSTGSLWAGGLGPTVEFNLTALTGTVVEGSGVTFTIEDYGNGWRRCSVTGTCVTSGNTAYSLFVKQYFAYIGNGTDGIYAWGANITATGYVQSYIPTLGAAVTRGADAASKTGISSLIGQTQGTLFVDMTKTTAETSERYLVISDGTTSNRVIILAGASGAIRGLISASGSTQFDYTSSVSAIGTHKIAIAYANNDVVMYIDGVQVTTDSSATIPAVANLYVGTHEVAGTERLNGGLNQALLFKTRLSNADLAALTA